MKSLPHTIRILAVDDEVSYHNLIREIFDDEEEYHISFAENARSALAILELEAFDCVLMDHNMPGMTGMELCRIIRDKQKFRLLPIIMVTGMSSQFDLVRAMHAGADDFIGKPFSPVEMVARVRTAAQRNWAINQLDNAEHILYTLAHMVEARDSTTGHHCIRLSHIGQVFGRRLNLGPEELLALRRGAILHDIGKLVVPDAILNKNGPLSPEEWQIMGRHSVIGAELCKGLSTMKSTLPIIRHHHEQYNGGGYPDGLRGEEIPLLARVFQIIDIHDALSNKRPYKEAMPPEKVRRILQEEADKGKSDPRLATVFLELLDHETELLVFPETSTGTGENNYLDMCHQGILEGTRFQPIQDGDTYSSTLATLS